jgi:hypothetical protein
MFTRASNVVLPNILTLSCERAPQMVGNNKNIFLGVDYEGEKMFSQTVHIFLKQEDISRMPKMFGHK